jgi:hypothetical protein
VVIEYQKLGNLKRMEIYFLQFWRKGKPKIERLTSDKCLLAM